MKLQDLGTSVETLSGVGQSTAKLLAKMSIFTVADLLSTWPRDYEDKTKRIALSEYADFEKVHTVCKVTGHAWIGYGKKRTLKLSIADESAEACLVAFNRPFLEKTLPIGSIILVSGHFEVKYNTLQSTGFEVSKLATDGNLKDYSDVPLPDSGIHPIYPLTEGLSQKTMRKIVSLALKQYGKLVEDEIPSDIIKERHLLNKAEALVQIHTPDTIEQIKEARKTLIYEEFFLFERKLALRTLEHRGTLPALEGLDFLESPKTPLPKEMPSAAPYFAVPQITEEHFISELSPRQKKLYSSLPFSLTEGQMSVILEMGKDIDRSQIEENALKSSPSTVSSTPFSMQRLLQGDVGSGKTLVAFFLCLRTIDYGGQCAILAPTELLARQHAENAYNLLSGLNVDVAFLTGNLKAAGRNKLVAELKNGEIDIAIGTHALFSANTQYKNLQLAVIDEQHRFGVAQRDAIIAKGIVSSPDGRFSHAPDVLMMSATPIPQTLALTAFGDLDVSTIHTMPNGRRPVRTLLSVMGHESNVYEAVRKELLAGHQAYFVYPRISETAQAQDTLKNAEDMYEYLSSKVYKDFTCAIVHSKVDESAQNEILADFKKNKIQVLVATTVVEVGVDVPNATCIVIEHADRFGLAELHQLRGRVGRSSLQSYCFLIYGKNITEDGKQRLKALHESNDGFKIAEEDLRLRGPGEVLGTAQSGYLMLSIADFARDKDILIKARYDAFSDIRLHRTQGESS